MAVNTINVRLQDAESDTKRATVPIYVPTGLTLAQYQAFATTAAPIIDAVTGSLITDIDLVVALTKPGSGIKTTPVDNSLNERGGLIGMDTAGQFNDSIRIPAILWEIMTGDSFSLEDDAVAALTLLLTAGDGTVFPRTRDGFTFSGAGLYGKKSFRRK
jgi:hypothetical protein